jgi:hypothetical protein
MEKFPGDPSVRSIFNKILLKKKKVEKKNLPKEI